ncbi:MAG TPA: S41 family peptidase [Dongiaceae bacterium]|nr:S41 family peptidase [Dongiaceae bacterium]
MKLRSWLVTAAVTVAFVSLSAAVGQSSNDNSNTYQQLNLFGDVFEKIRSDYVEPVSDEKLIEAAINGMLTSLDPHSSYMNPKEWDDMQVQTKGEFGGLGIEVTMEDGVIKVVSPIDGTPAAKAGIQPGDLIVQIDNKPILGLTLSQAVDKMRGPIDSKIVLTIRRGKQPNFDVTLQRAIIKIQSVRGELIDNVGYIRITSFSEQTSGGLQETISKLKGQAGKKLQGIVLDLRNNPGGLLDQAIAVCDDFLDKGEIVSTRGRDPNNAQRYNATGGDLLQGLPIVVLINGGSASASEIVAGALQDHHRAILLGTRSFGKGSVQTIIPIAGHGAIRLTTARYYTPSGRSIQAKGIEPDIVVEQAKIEPIAEPKFRGEADLPGALQNTGGTAPDESGEQPLNPQQPSGSPSTNRTAPAAPAQATDTEKPQPDKDYQLSRALDLLHGIALVEASKAN